MMAFLLGPLGRFVIGGVLIAGLILLWQLDRSSQRRIGALSERVSTEQANNAAIDQANRVGARSRDPLVDGVRDPYAGPDVE